MITKDRLEELIKEGATIYNKYSGKYKLDENDFVGIKFGKVFLKTFDNIGFIYDCDYLENFFETEKQAEWALKYHATRTEELDLPTWEDFTSTENSIIRFYVRERKYTMYTFVKNKKTNNCRILIRVDNGEQDWLVFEEPATEENYEKACDLCLKLFEGEEK